MNNWDMSKKEFIKKLKYYIDRLADEDRLELIHQYCMGCGTKDLPCYCMRDEQEVEMEQWEPSREVIDKMNEVLDNPQVQKDEFLYLSLIFGMMGLVVEGITKISEQLVEIYMEQK